MKNKFNKGLVLGVIILFLGVVVAPVINSMPLNDNNIHKMDFQERHNMTAFFCKVYIDNITDIFWSRPGWFVVTTGTVRIDKALVLLDEDTMEKTYFGYFNCTGKADVFMLGFLFKGSSKPNQMQAFAIFVNYIVDNSI